jgi:hypothetical protein
MTKERVLEYEQTPPDEARNAVEVSEKKRQFAPQIVILSGVEGLDEVSCKYRYGIPPLRPE